MHRRTQVLLFVLLFSVVFLCFFLSKCNSFASICYLSGAFAIHANMRRQIGGTLLDIATLACNFAFNFHQMNNSNEKSLTQREAEANKWSEINRSVNKNIQLNMTFFIHSWNYIQNATINGIISTYIINSIHWGLVSYIVTSTYGFKRYAIF